MSKDCNFTFAHIPVLFNECMENLDIKEDGIYVDCTAGGGGHSSGILERLGKNGRLISLDKDDNALAVCEEKRARYFSDKNWTLYRSDFNEI